MIRNMQKENLHAILVEAYDPDLELCGRWMAQRLVSSLEKDTLLPANAKTAVLTYLTAILSAAHDYTIPSLVVTKNVEKILHQYKALHLLTKS